MKFEKLKNIVEVKKGKKPSFVETPDKNSVRVLQIDDLRNDTNPKFTNDKTGVFAKEDDVLIAWDGANAGTIGYGKSGYIGSTIALLRKRQPDLYSTTFIGIFLQSQYQYLRSKTTGATIPHISRKALDELEVPVISVDDQLHIANLLSKSENLIAQRKESIRLLDEFLKSTFLEMFGDPVRNEKGWNKSELKNYAKVRIGPFGSLLHREDYVQNGVPLVNPSHIGDGKIFIDLELTISKNKMKELSAYVMQEGDIVLGRRGEIGRCAVVTKKEEGYLCGTGSIYIRPITQLNPIFIYNIISSASIRKVLENSAKGITMKNLNSGIIENLKIPVPPIELQTQFAQIVEKTEAIKTQYQQSLQELENLYGSLSQRAFKGELSIKDESLLMAAEPSIEYNTNG
jgi:type I restriction enzyme S subunit